MSITPGGNPVCPDCGKWYGVGSSKKCPHGPVRIVCPDCGMSTWIDGEGCALPGCENFRVLIDPLAGDPTKGDGVQYE